MTNEETIQYLEKENAKPNFELVIRKMIPQLFLGKSENAETFLLRAGMISLLAKNLQEEMITGEISTEQLANEIVIFKEDTLLKNTESYISRLIGSKSEPLPEKPSVKEVIKDKVESVKETVSSDINSLLEALNSRGIKFIQVAGTSLESLLRNKLGDKYEGEIALFNAIKKLIEKNDNTTKPN